MEPNWQHIDLLPPFVPESIRTWLTAEVSLTTRLRQLGTFSVQLLQETWGQSELSECHLLNMDAKARTWQRNVALLVNGKPKVIAHTVIPSATLTALPELQHLANRSLGDLIFKDLHGMRKSLEFTQLIPGHSLYALAEPFHPTTNLWARRSLLVAKDCGLLVNEVFI